MRFKSAFSMMESLVVIVIIGTLAIFSIPTIKAGGNKYDTLYYAAYNTLRQAIHNVYADAECPYLQNTTNAVADEINEATNEDIANYTGNVDNVINLRCCANGNCNPRPFPVNSYELCERLSEYIPTIKSSKRCGTPSSIPNNVDNLDIDDKAEDFDILTGNDRIDNKVRFVSANSMKFYFSRRHSGAYNYFIVYVDLNGDKMPNSVYPVCNKARDTSCFPEDTQPEQFKAIGYIPDIVAFVVTDNGEIAPIGLPVFSKDYLTAKVRYPSYGEKNGEYVQLTEEEQFSDSVTYMQAIKQAWGDTNNSILQSIDFTDELFNSGKTVYRHGQDICQKAPVRSVAGQTLICRNKNNAQVKKECKKGTWKQNGTVTINKKKYYKYVCSSSGTSEHCLPSSFNKTTTYQYCCKELNNKCTTTAWSSVSAGAEENKLVSFFYKGNYLNKNNKNIYPSIDSSVTKNGQTYKVNCQSGEYTCRVNINKF